MYWLESIEEISTDQGGLSDDESDVFLPKYVPDPEY